MDIVSSATGTSTPSIKILKNREAWRSIENFASKMEICPKEEMVRVN